LLTERDIAIAAALELIAIVYTVQCSEAYETPNMNSADLVTTKYIVQYIC
jgi:hypothetical protein